jgi:hypothetical protein
MPPKTYKPKSKTAQILIEKTPFFAGLPLDVVGQIELFSRRGAGRPRATPQQKQKAQKKQQDTTRMRARAEKAIKQGKLQEAEQIVNEMNNLGLLGKRAKKLTNQIDKLREVKQMESGMKKQKEEQEKLLDMLAEDIATQSIDEAQEELKQEEAPQLTLEQEEELAEDKKEIRQFLQNDIFSANEYQYIIGLRNRLISEGLVDKDDKMIRDLKNHITKLLDDPIVVDDIGKDNVIALQKDLGLSDNKVLELPTPTISRQPSIEPIDLVKTKNISPQEAQKQVKKMKVVKQFTSEKEALLAKENQLVFGELAKQKSTTTQSDLQHNFTSVDKSKPKEDKPKTNIPYATMPKQLRNYLREYLRDNFDLVPDYDETEFVMDNFVDDETKQRLIENDARAGGKIGEIIQNARETQRFVPENIEGNENMTKEERQILFHKLMIENRSVRESVMKGKTNFDNYDMMSGGVNAGLETKTKKDEESVPIKLPDEFRDYEFILDSKIKDNAEARELFKGINPNAIIDSGNEELIAAYFAKMNDLSNEQDNREINEAVENIEILSGGNKDTLFGATDLLTTRGNLNVRFNQDLPDNIPDNPAPLERGRDARAIPEVDVDAINRENRADYATTIASGIGVLGNAYRGIFGKNDIPASRGQNDILEDINQNIRLIGKRGIYGDDKSLKTDDDMYEGTTLDKRLSSLREFRNQRILGENNPEMLGQHAQAAEQDDALRNAMMFNRGAGGAQGATLQQLRQQEFAYNQANRRVSHDGRQFIRGGRGTQIKIEQEYDP